LRWRSVLGDGGAEGGEGFEKSGLTLKKWGKETKRERDEKG